MYIKIVGNYDVIMFDVCICNNDTYNFGTTDVIIEDTIISVNM